ncbi:MAG: hypothetical protein A4E73_00150 [Syntrophaceae bacterium PtaU1.Bin231]|nr:MAG: hypothetical protein A4E73_00150 [Syntrophaceae bacterium PtaU1.Bin231]
MIGAVHKIGKGLVDDEERFRMPAAELSERLRLDAKTGGVVRPADEHEIVLPETPLQRGDVQGESFLFPEKAFLHRKPGQFAGGGIVRVSGHRNDGPFFVEGPRYQVQDLRGTVSEEHLIRGEAPARAEGPGEGRAVRVRILRNPAEPRADYRPEPLRRTEGIDIGREVQDLRLGKSRRPGQAADVSPVFGRLHGIRPR